MAAAHVASACSQEAERDWNADAQPTLTILFMPGSSSRKRATSYGRSPRFDEPNVKISYTVCPLCASIPVNLTITTNHHRAGISGMYHLRSICFSC